MTKGAQSELRIPSLGAANVNLDAVRGNEMVAAKIAGQANSVDATEADRKAVTP